MSITLVQNIGMVLLSIALVISAFRKKAVISIAILIMGIAFAILMKNV